MTPLLWFSNFFLKKKVKVLVIQCCPTLCDPMDWNPLSSSVHGILQAWILEWVASLFSGGSFRPRSQTWVSSTTGRFFTVWARQARFFLKWHANSGQELKHWGHCEQGKNHIRDLPGGPVVKNLHFHCRCSAWIPGQELRSHMTWGVASPQNEIAEREGT